MPLYEYRCPDCGREEEVILYDDTKVHCPDCRINMQRQFAQIAMVKNKGWGGYPSRQKYFKGSAPFSGKGAPVPYGEENPLTASKNPLKCHEWRDSAGEA